MLIQYSKFQTARKFQNGKSLKKSQNQKIKRLENDCQCHEMTLDYIPKVTHEIVNEIFF